MANPGSRMRPPSIQLSQALPPPDPEQTAARLKERRRTLFGDSAAAIQREAVQALSKIAERERSHPSMRLPQDVPIEAVRLQTAAMSLDAMLAGWNEIDLWKLIDSEDVRDLRSDTKLALHIVAANTPLLIWSSVARALLIGAASLVRLPQGSYEADYWAERFQRALAEASPELAALVETTRWSSDDEESTQLAVAFCDTVVAYGSDTTVDKIRALIPPTVGFVGYGHRFSIGIVLSRADYLEAAEGTALDMRIFDQQGCLSPQIVFVQGALSDASRFADALTRSLGGMDMSFPSRGAGDVSRIREALAVARFQPGASAFRHREFAWTLLLSPVPHSASFGVPGMITIAPFARLEEIIDWLHANGLFGRLQGVSIAANQQDGVGSEQHAALQKLGASYICAPGRLQRPPFSWREDNLDLLRSLIRP